MGLFKKVAKWLGYVVGGVVGLAVLAYLGLLIINWSDRSPSESALLLAEVYESKEAIPAEKNAFVTIMGFSGPREIDPFELGVERIEWLLNALKEPDRELSGDPLGRYTSTSYVYGWLEELGEACEQFDQDCATAYETNIGILESRVTDEQWMLERYRSLLAMSQYQEVVPFDLRAPLPAYHIVLHGQKLLLTNAWLAARRGDVANVRRQLNDDITFWRRALKSSDTLISKMIAVAAIARNFGMGNLILRRLREEVPNVDPPASWKLPISQSERSMQRVFAGEWKFGNDVLKQLLVQGDNPIVENYYLDEETLLEKFLWALGSPLLQPQDLSNKSANRFVQAIELFKADYSSLPTAHSSANQLNSPAQQRFSRAYNAMGDFLFSMSWSRFGDYGARVSDLEGHRRVAVLMIELRNRGVTTSTVEADLLTTEYNDPYTGEPFEWKPCSGEVAFSSLMPNVRAKPHFPL